MKSFTTGLIVLFILVGSSHAQEVSDEELLEDLGVDLLEPAQTEDVSPLDEQLLEDLGEDVGAQQLEKNKQLSEVVANMEQASRLLEQFQDSAQPSAIQEQALTGLDAMIAEILEKKSQCSGGKSGKPADRKPDKKPGDANKSGKTAANASTTSPQDEPIPTALSAAGDLVKDLWGHLPRRQRDQILQPLSAEFLPKYATEIEAYFQKLAEP